MRTRAPSPRPFTTAARTHPADPRRRPSRRWAAVLVGLAALGLIAAAERRPGPGTDPVAALVEGNRLFRDGRLEEALTAYRAGWDPENVHPTLVYNLATTLHHLDRLPEAILWYRRGAGSDDPWLTDNLWLARRTLGNQTLPASGPAHLARRSSGPLRGLAIVLAWVVAVSVATGSRRMPGWVLVATASIAVVAWSAAVAGTRWAPRPAVLLEDCSTAAGDLPAGTEAWVRPAGEEAWRVVAQSAEAVCPAVAVGVIDAAP